MDVLVCDREGNARGATSVALSQLIESSSSAQLRFWLLQRLESQSEFRLVASNQHLEACGSLDELLNWLKSYALVGVGWHTWSENVVRRAQQLKIPVASWSYGVGCFVFYRLRSVARLLRLLIRAPALLGATRTLRTLGSLFVAYPRCSCWDSRSLDAAIANWLGCPVRLLRTRLIRFMDSRFPPMSAFSFSAGEGGPPGEAEGAYPSAADPGGGSFA